MQHEGEEGRVAVDGLGLSAFALIAESELSPDQVEEARRSGTAAMPALRRVKLEAGGIILAEGRLARRKGASVFIVEKTFENGGRA